MTDRLPPNLLALFTPRPPLRWVPPCDKAPEQRKTTTISGVAEFLPAAQKYAEEIPYHPTESWLEARDRKQREKKEAAQKLLTEAPEHYKPSDDPNIRGDAFKTLIVARLDYSADEKDLEREFGRFGPIERIRIVRDTHADEKPNKKIKPHRGYAFVVYEREKDMRAALDQCDGIRIKDRRIKVDVERGRTVKGWKPRRLGGGLGGRGYTKAAMPRPMGPTGYGGGGGGGFGGRGGFGGGGGFRGRDRGFRGGGGGFGGGDRGGFRGGGFGGRGGGGDRNFGGDRPPFGDRGSGGPPNAPSGPGGGFGGRERDNRRDGFGGSAGGAGGAGGGGDRGGFGRDGGSRSYDDRSGGGFRGGDRNPRQSGSNMEPIRPRGEFGGYGGSDRGGDRGGGDRGASRDYDRPREDDSRKRGYEGSYEDPRKLRRY